MADPDESAPISVGEEYVVDIEDIGREGDGIARIESFILFVPDAELGERVPIRVESVQESFATATVVDEPSE